jgi:hypothetical protein
VQSRYIKSATTDKRKSVSGITWAIRKTMGKNRFRPAEKP